MSFVVDASFSAAWCFDDEATVETDRHFRLAATEGIIVPALWVYEVANLLRSAERRQRINVAESDYRLKLLRSLSMLDEESSIERTWTTIIGLARRFQLTVYDASYIELAARLNLPLATRDKEMIAAARELELAVILA